MQKKAIILINVGTPDNTSVKDVRRYLSEFLNDKNVIDLPYLLRKILVNLIIVPFRAPKSAKLYEKIWSENGSPFMSYSLSLIKKLKSKVNDADIFLAMRYGKPSLFELLRKLGKTDYSEFIFVPLYPQYAASTTGSVNELIRKLTSDWRNKSIKIIGQFYSHPAFVHSFANLFKKYDIDSYDHVIFSFHGLPLSHIRKSHPQTDMASCYCVKSMPEHGKFCYKATCYETARLIASELNLDKDKYSVTFQSRLTKDWLSPFTDKVLKDKASSGIKKILIVSPAFVTDCLETLYELEIENYELFTKHGGEKMTLVKSLNDCNEWVDALLKIIS